jgi:hypothetical protein
MVIGYWLLVDGCWLLVDGCWLLVIGQLGNELLECASFSFLILSTTDLTV